MNPASPPPPCRCTNNHQPESIKASASVTQKTTKAMPSVLLSVLIAFFPKCPICWAVYMSMFSGWGLVRLPYMGWLFPLLLMVLSIHLIMLFRRSSSQGYLPFLLSLVGTVFIVGSRNLFPTEPLLPLIGMGLISAGSFANSFLFTRLPYLLHKNNLNR